MWGGGYIHLKLLFMKNSLVVQWLGFCAFTAEGPSSIPSQGTKIPQVLRYGQKKKSYHLWTFILQLRKIGAGCVKEQEKHKSASFVSTPIFASNIGKGKGRESVNFSVLSDPFTTPWTAAHQTPLSMNSPGKNTGVGCHFLLQGTFPTQRLNPGLLHCRQILLPSEPTGKPYYEVICIT